MKRVIGSGARWGYGALIAPIAAFGAPASQVDEEP